MAGKDKLQRGTTLIFDDSGGTPRDLSSDLVPGSLKGPGFSQGEIPMFGESAAVESHLADRKTAPVEAQFFMNDTASTGAFTVLNGQEGLGGTLTIAFGSNGAAPTTNDPEWEGEYIYFPQQTSFVDGRPVINAKFQPQSGQSDPAWGQVA